MYPMGCNKAKVQLICTRWGTFFPSKINAFKNKCKIIKKNC